MLSPVAEPLQSSQELPAAAVEGARVPRERTVVSTERIYALSALAIGFLLLATIVV